MSILAPYLFPELKRRYEYIKVLKKDNSYITVTCSKFIMKDAYRFTSPCSLSKYLKQNGVVEKKGIFPYTAFSCIEEIEAQIEFPEFHQFYSELRKSNVPRADYDEARDEYNRRRQLPRDNPDHMENFKSWLIHYNLLDTAPLAEAVHNSFGSFFEIFKMDPSWCVSLPAFAQQCMFREYEKDEPLCYSFCKKQAELRKMFRENLRGGLVNVYHRAIDLTGRNDVPKSAQVAPSGDKYSSLLFLDFNSLYLHAQLQPFPASPGIHWKLHPGKYFSKSVMTYGCSFAALQWLTFIDENSPALNSSDGSRVRLEHAFFRGEKVEGPWTIDGYAEVDERKFYFEFLGCHFHDGCPKCKPGTRDERFERKKKYLENFGTLFYIRECEWNQKLRKLRNVKSSRLPQIYEKYGKEKKIIEGIRSGNLFGFIVADFTTPEKLLDEIRSLNFPPIIQRGVIDESMASPYMRQRCAKRDFKFPQKTLLQTYNAKQMLVYSPTVRFYLQLGIEVSNITTFVQYEPSRPLRPFVEKITKGRIDAVKDKNDSLGLAYKIIGNR